MLPILNSERDRRTYEWLVTQVGQEAVNAAMVRLLGRRKPYVSNIAKILGLTPPESVRRTSSEEARARLSEIKAMLAASRGTRTQSR